MNRKQCEGCSYFIAGNYANKAGAGERFCHYMLLTGQRRKRGEDDKCLSRTTKRIKKPTFDIPIQQI